MCVCLQLFGMMESLGVEADRVTFHSLMINSSSEYIEALMEAMRDTGQYSSLLCLVSAHHVSLCLAMSHCALLCLAISHCVLLCLTLSRYALLCLTVSHCVLLYHTAPCYASLCLTISHVTGIGVCTETINLLLKAKLQEEPHSTMALYDEMNTLCANNKLKPDVYTFGLLVKVLTVLTVTVSHCACASLRHCVSLWLTVSRYVSRCVSLCLIVPVSHCAPLCLIVPVPHCVALWLALRLGDAHCVSLALLLYLTALILSLLTLLIDVSRWLTLIPLLAPKGGRVYNAPNLVHPESQSWLLSNARYHTCVIS